MKIVAFLPVKGSSERIKNKNTTLMNGKPFIFTYIGKTRTLFFY